MDDTFYKTSKFNLWVNNNKGIFLVNTLTKSILEINEDERELVKKNHFE